MLRPTPHIALHADGAIIYYGEASLTIVHLPGVMYSVFAFLLSLSYLSPCTGYIHTHTHIYNKNENNVHMM